MEEGGSEPGKEGKKGSEGDGSGGFRVTFSEEACTRKRAFGDTTYYLVCRKIRIEEKVSVRAAIFFGSDRNKIFGLTQKPGVYRTKILLPTDYSTQGVWALSI